MDQPFRVYGLNPGVKTMILSTTKRTIKNPGYGLKKPSNNHPTCVRIANEEHDYGGLFL